jgi:hypothetical protein
MAMRRGMKSSLPEGDYTACPFRRKASAAVAMFLPQLIAGNPDSRHGSASIRGFNSGVSNRRSMESKMETKSRSVTFIHRRVVLDMLQLALHGTAAAIAVAALALGLIALLAG